MLAPTGFWILARAQYIVAAGGCPRQDQALPLSRAPLLDLHRNFNMGFRCSFVVYLKNWE